MFSALDILDLDLSQETTPFAKPGAFRPKLKPRGPKGTGPSAPKQTSGNAQGVTKKPQKPNKSQSSDTQIQVNDTQPGRQVCNILKSPTKQSVEAEQLQKELLQNLPSSQCLLEVDLSQPQSQICNASQSPGEQSVDVFTHKESLQPESSISLVVQLDDSQPQSQVCGTSGALLEQQVQEPFPQSSRVEETSTLGFPLDDEYLFVDLGSSPNHLASEIQKDDEQMSIDETIEKEPDSSSESPVTPAEPQRDLSTSISNGTSIGNEQSLSEQPYLNDSPETETRPTYHHHPKRKQDEDSLEPGSSKSHGCDSKKNANLLEKGEGLEQTNTISPTRETTEDPLLNEETELDKFMETQGKATSSGTRTRKKRKGVDTQQNAQHENEENKGVPDTFSNGKKSKKSEVAKSCETNASGAKDTSNLQVNESNECVEEGQDSPVKKYKKSGKHKEDETIAPTTSPSSAKKTRKMKSLRSSASTRLDVGNALDDEVCNENLATTTSPNSGKKSRKKMSSISSAEASTQQDAGNTDTSANAKKSRKIKSPIPSVEASAQPAAGNDDAPDNAKKSRKTKSPKNAAIASSDPSSRAGNVDGEYTKEDQEKKKFIKPVLHRRRVDRRALNPADPDLDPKKMTIKDIIRLAEAKERMMKQDEAKKAKSLGVGVAVTSVQEEEVEETTNFAPQVQIINGRIVINQESLTVTAHKRDDFRTYRRVEETHSKLNYHSYMNKTPRIAWRSDETDLFYKALREFGTNFAMIQHLFPGRTRKQILLKYKKEERCSPMRVAEAMTLKAKGCAQYMEVINMMNIVPVDEQDNPEESTDFEMTSNQEVDNMLPSTMESESEVVGNDENDEVKEEEKENGRTLDGCDVSRHEADTNNVGPSFLKPDSPPKSEEPKVEESQASEPVVRKKRSLFSYQATTVT